MGDRKPHGDHTLVDEGFLGTESGLQDSLVGIIYRLDPYDPCDRAQPGKQ